MLYEPVGKGGGLQRGESRRGKVRKEKTATSAWIEGARYINPKPSQVEGQSDRNQRQEEAVGSMKCSRPSRYLALPQWEVFGDTIYDSW
jgi:hypothetical protein